MNNKVFISCAVTGSGDTASKHPDLPKTPEQIATASIEAAKAGAAIAHIHVREDDGTPSRSFCYVSDSIRGFLKILFFGKSGSIYKVGNDEEISMKELAIEIKNLVGNTEIIYKKNQDKHYTTDNPQKRVPDLTKIKKELEFFPKISLDEGLKRVYAWYKESLQ